MGDRLFRLRAACGIAGPAAFTTAWVVSGARQGDYSIVREHLSGLAALDAIDPEIMIAGFVTLGACTALFGTALGDALGWKGRAGIGPKIVGAAGMAIVAAGVLRRDHLLLKPAGEVLPPSWHNTGHDIASGLVYSSLMLAPFVLADRFRGDPDWRGLATPAMVSALATGALLALYASKILEPYNGILQRVAVSVPAAGMVVLAARLLRSER